MSSKTTNLTFRVSRELKEQFQKEAEANGTTVTALFHQWMREYVSGNQPSTNSTNNVGAETRNGTALTKSTDNALTARVEAIEQELYRLKANLPSAFAESNPISSIPSNYESEQDSTDKALTSTNNVGADQKEVALTSTNNISAETEEPARTSTNTALTNDDSPTDGDEGDHNEGNESPKDKDSVGPLTQSALGERLGCRGNTILHQRKKGSAKLKEWSKQKDPDGIAWEYRSDKKYHPVVDL